MMIHERYDHRDQPEHIYRPTNWRIVLFVSAVLWAALFGLFGR